jgi:endoglucanase
MNSKRPLPLIFVPSLFLLTLMLLSSTAHAQLTSNIQLNQLGFYPHGPKIAVINSTISSTKFYLLSANKKDTVYRGNLTDSVHPEYSTIATHVADFSSFSKPGNYIVYIKDAGFSFPFTIGNNAQHAAAAASLKGYYFQRVSMPLEAQYAGKWARPAGHPDTAILIHPSAATAQRPAGSIISCPGGWYDAGDYNKYIVNSGITMGTLLSAYEDFPAYFKTLQTNIPESSDAIPDILNEIIYNLRWMLTMQDPNDGGVYNKCTNAAFDAMVMPGVTKLPRYVVQKGTAATLDFAAVTAQAARILKAFNKQLPGLADSCNAASIKAWQWAQQNPALEYNQFAMNAKFDPKITTGGYGDRKFTDEWFWAACELYSTTKDKSYQAVINQYWKDTLSLPSWGNVLMLGYYTLIRNEKSLKALGGIDFEQAKQRVITMADNLISNGGDKAYQTILGQSRRDFIWGSNSVALNQSIVLINAWMITKDKKYIQSALSNLDYVLGRNATGYCFVTGIGTKSTRNPHHRQSVSDGIDDPVPGLLAGGPNPGQQDRCPGYPSRMPAESYTDSNCAYASNEIAINWNAPLVYVSNAIEALQQHF